MSTKKLSVIIITHNESANIADCINSVSFADEIIVVDSNSDDETPKIVNELGAYLIHTDNWPGFGAQKNYALSLATAEWVLSIDADERVTPALREEIISVISTPLVEAYYIPRLSSFLGDFIYHGGWHPDYVLRLFKNNSGKFSNSIVHEKFLSNQIAHLKNHLIHYSYPTDSDYLRKLETYSTAGALAAHKKNKKSNLKIIITHTTWAFLRSYIIKLGFLDGRAGFLVAVSSAESTYHKYLKLMLLHEKE
jgi:glycosyltransferase involved in cell wall biosynthesis